MLTKIFVKNLCCYDDIGTSIDFSEESIFVGPNNSGKSTIFAGLNLMRNISYRGLAWTTEYYNLVDFENAVNNHDINKEIVVSATLDAKTYTLHVKKGNVIGVEAIDSDGTSIPISLEVFKNIWYLRPNRALLPYLTDVAPTGGPLQPLNPDCSNVINFLVERFTDRDDRWDKFEKWLGKVDPDISHFKPPIKGRSCSFETLMANVPVNASLQGSGFHSAASIIASLIFSPRNATVIIEEPEVFLHKDTQEVLADLFNEVVSSEQKQVIFSTHSWDMLLPFASDIIQDASKRGASHVLANSQKFKMFIFSKISGKVTVNQYPLVTKTFRQLKDDLKITWG